MWLEEYLSGDVCKAWGECGWWRFCDLLPVPVCTLGDADVIVSSTLLWVTTRISLAHYEGGIFLRSIISALAEANRHLFRSSQASSFFQSHSFQHPGLFPRFKLIFCYNVSTVAFLDLLPQLWEMPMTTHVYCPARASVLVRESDHLTLQAPFASKLMTSIWRVLEYIWGVRRHLVTCPHNLTQK